MNPDRSINKWGKVFIPSLHFTYLYNMASFPWIHRTDEPKWSYCREQNEVTYSLKPLISNVIPHGYLDLGGAESTN